MKPTVAILLLCILLAVLFHAAGGTSFAGSKVQPAWQGVPQQGQPVEVVVTATPEPTPTTTAVVSIPGPSVTPAGTAASPTAESDDGAGGEDVAESWVAFVDVEGANPLGRLFDLPQPGEYEFAIVSGSYDTGTHQRSVVAVLVNPASYVFGCGPYNEPCVGPDDFYVGDWNTPSRGHSVIRTLNSSTLRLIAIDDMGSYGHMNSGSVRVQIREVK